MLISPSRSRQPGLPIVGGKPSRGDTQSGLLLLGILEKSAVPGGTHMYIYDREDYVGPVVKGVASCKDEDGVRAEAYINI